MPRRHARRPTTDHGERRSNDPRLEHGDGASAHVLQPRTVSPPMLSRDPALSRRAVARDGDGDGTGVYVWDLDKGCSPAFPSGSDTAPRVWHTQTSINPSWHFSEDGILRRWSANDRRIRDRHLRSNPCWRVDPDQPMMETFTAATFFAGGRKLALTHADSGLHVVDVESGKQTGRVRNAKLVAASPTKQRWRSHDGTDDTIQENGQ